MSETSFSNVQERDVQVTVRDPSGNVVALENTGWESIDPTICEVIVDPTDPLKATLRSTGAVGNTVILFYGDADLSDGELIVQGFINVEITDSGEFFFEFQFGDQRRRDA